jgi:hypothetical protein
MLFSLATKSIDTVMVETVLKNRSENTEYGENHGVGTRSPPTRDLSSPAVASIANSPYSNSNYARDAAGVASLRDLQTLDPSV